MTFKADKIWMDGELVPWEDAKIHVLCHIVHYGTGAFEGIRSYEIAGIPHIFRFKEHVKRLMDSCKLYRMDPPYSSKEIETAIGDTIKANNLKSCYIRPLVFRGFGELGINPFKCPIHTMIAAWSWGTYLGEEALEKGIHACTSSWNRAAANTFPTLAKICGNYINSQLIKIEAHNNGFAEGIAPDPGRFYQ